MTRQELNIALCAILTTLDEVEYAPESSLYMALDNDIDKYGLVRDLLVKAGLVKRGHDTLKLTDKGREMVKQIKGPILDKVPNGKTLTPAG